MQKQIVKNTIYLYLRQLILLIVSLYTVRVVLEVLGVENYGIYNVIAGFVSMFNIVCTNLNITTQRYLSSSIGSYDNNIISKYFSNSFALHLLLGVIVIILLETIGLLGFDSLNIPNNRYTAAMIVFQISVLTMFLSITQVPYNALVIANEKMHIFAYISIVEAALKLLLVLLLLKVKCDVLVVYAILMFVVQCTVMLSYRLYSIQVLNHQSKFKRCEVSRNILKEMIQFSGWSLLTSSSWILKAQGVNMVLNIFFGATINAARGITNQIVSVVTSFMLNFQMAANPKINQHYVTGDIYNMQILVYQSIKISFILLLLAFVPIWIEIDTILSLWLVNIPEYTSLFIRILIIELILDSATGPLATAVRATGKVRNYSIADFSILIWNMPICWLVFKLGYGPQSAYIVSLIITTIAIIVRHIIVINQLKYSWRLYWNNVICREFVLLIFGVAIALILFTILPCQTIFIQICVVTGVIILMGVLSYIIGLTKSERSSVNNIVISKLKCLI